MSDLASDMHNSPAGAEVASRDDGRRRRSIARRSIAGLSAVGIATTVLMTSAASSGAAMAGPPTPVRAGTTLTGTTSSAAGVMRMRINYVAPRRKAVFLSVTFTGHSRIAIKRPSLVFVLASALPPVTKGPNGASTIRVKPGPRIIVIALKLRPGTRNFSGSFPRRLLAGLSRVGGPVPGETLSMTLASSLSLRKGVRAFGPVMQVGLQLSPTVF